jgi:hypothetical protein
MTEAPEGWWKKLGGPLHAAIAQPGGGEAVLAMAGYQLGDAELVGFRRGRREG